MARAVLAMTARDQNKRLKSPGLFVINRKPSYTFCLFVINKKPTGWFFWLVPPRKVLSMELVPPNRKKCPSTLVPPKTHEQQFFQHSRPNHLFIYTRYCSNRDTTSHFPPFKMSPTHSNASPGLVFHLQNWSDNHGLLVVVDIVDHVLCVLE